MEAKHQNKYEIYTLRNSGMSLYLSTVDFIGAVKDCLFMLNHIYIIPKISKNLKTIIKPISDKLKHNNPRETKAIVN